MIAVPSGNKFGDRLLVPGLVHKPPGKLQRGGLRLVKSNVASSLARSLARGVSRLQALF